MGVHVLKATLGSQLGGGNCGNLFRESNKPLFGLGSEMMVCILKR